jgi:(S)-3,5-dihydroxyphenylglycine transaminase
MNFLNEVAGEYPTAISFAAGRPTDEFFGRLGPEQLQAALSGFAREIADSGGSRTFATLLQYGRTAGIINHLIAAQLRTDEHVPAEADRLLVTSGCQEALSLCIGALCPDVDDALLVCNPTYIGASGAAHANDVHVRARDAQHDAGGADLFDRDFRIASRQCRSHHDQFRDRCR